MKKHNKTLFLLTLATAVTVPVVVGSQHSNASNEVITNYEPTVAVATSKTFKDISSKYVYRDIIYKMAAQNIISGYEDGTFRPNETLSRKHAAALVNRAVKLPKTTTFKAPKDLSTKNSYYLDIKALMEAGLLNVDSRGYINPNAPLTRGEMAKILAVAFDLEGTKHPLTDVSKEIEEYVSALYENGVTTGYEDNTFREKQPLTRSHFALFMYRAMNNDGVEDETETEEEQPTEEIDIIGSLVMTDIKALKDIPLPKGHTDAEELTKSLEKEYSKIFKEKGFGANSATLVVKRLTSVESSVKETAEIIDKSVEEVIDLYNEAFLTGKVITSDEDDKVPFAIYFDYKLGLMHFGFKN